MNQLDVSNVGHQYGRKMALTEATFQLQDGLVGILGHNGAGKTTLIKLITTLYPLKKGYAKLNDLDYNKDTERIRNELGYLPQDFQAYPKLSGKEFLHMIAELKMKNKRREERELHIGKIIQMLNMESYSEVLTKEYSGGMKQKLGIAQALIGNPKLIVLDEPTVGLDPEQRNVIRELFPVLSENRIVIVTTHIVEDIDFYCDYLIVLNEGKVVYQGKKAEFLTLAKGKIWIDNVDEEGWKEIAKNAKVINKKEREAFIEVRYICEKRLRESSQEEYPSLEDAYLYFQQKEGKAVC